MKKIAGVLNYDKDSGAFTWKQDIGTAVKKGDYAGGLTEKGYVKITHNGRQVTAHRLAWYITYGETPKEIDHINHNRADNRIENLRSVSKTENQRNRTKNKNNTSGVAGVHWHKSRKRWHANIKLDGRSKYLGSFTSFSDAVNSRKDAEVLYGFHSNHGKDI